MKRTAPLDDSEGNLPATEGKKRVVIASPPAVNLVNTQLIRLVVYDCVW